MKKYFKQLKANKKGFTLIEMVVVIAIIGILAAILVPSMSGYLSTARESKQEANARTIFTAAQAAVTSLETEASSIDGTFISKGTPSDDEKNNEDLFDKIEALIGESNYEKFYKITVHVKNGGVEYIEIQEEAEKATANDIIQYPKQPEE